LHLILGGKEAVTPIEGCGKSFMSDAVKLKDVSFSKYGEDILVEGYIEK
jgi:diaminohydroxyphosphoribosylaminopyrimidine deaminase/5-amino-6-(5-phosphoribosylamino)uracil reductase